MATRPKVMPLVTLDAAPTSPVLPAVLPLLQLQCSRPTPRRKSTASGEEFPLGEIPPPNESVPPPTGFSTLTLAQPATPRSQRPRPKEPTHIEPAKPKERKSSSQSKSADCRGVVDEQSKAAIEREYNRLATDQSTWSKVPFPCQLKPIPNSDSRRHVASWQKTKLTWRSI